MIDERKLKNNILVVIIALAVVAAILYVGRVLGKRAMEKEAVQAGAGEYYTVYTTNSEEGFRWKINTNR